MKAGGYQIFSIFRAVFVLLLIVLSWVVHDSLFFCFIAPFFPFFVSGSFNEALLVHGNWCVCFVKLYFVLSLGVRTRLIKKNIPQFMQEYYRDFQDYV